MSDIFKSKWFFISIGLIAILLIIGVAAAKNDVFTYYVVTPIDTTGAAAYNIQRVIDAKKDSIKKVNDAAEQDRIEKEWYTKNPKAAKILRGPVFTIVTEMAI
jgi:LPS O-antigen subunit length determinant protein (WzzB/FepE family)